MSLTRKQALDELQTMFPDYERDALDTFLRANSKPKTHLNRLDNLLNQTIECILTTGAPDSS